MSEQANNNREKEMIKNSVNNLCAWIDKNGWAGYDPYDGLNSNILNFKNRNLRIVLTQINRRSPINLRRILCIQKEINAKSIALFAASYLRLYKHTKEKQYLKKALSCLEWVEQNHNQNYSGFCWGYHFDWQSRAWFLPKNQPTIVATSYIANAFIDAYEELGKKKYLEIAKSSCEFILNDLNIYREGDKICFSYNPFDNTQIHNANMLGASLLSRVYKYAKDEKLLDYANKAIKHTIGHQRDDGAWYYGNPPSDFTIRIDNFHTGFILESLHKYMKNIGTTQYMAALIKGLNYYRKNLFLEDGTPRFTNLRTYPIDIRGVSQGIITFHELWDVQQGNEAFAEKIAVWAIENMQDPSGYFYYQKHRLYMNRIPYMRWSQACMLLALTTLLEAMGK